MATYQTITLPPAGIARGIMLAALTSSGATVYQRSNDATDGAEVRADGVYVTPLPLPVPPSWQLLAAPPT